MSQPFDGVGGFPGAPPWQVAGIVVLRQHWREYGDKTVVAEHYDSAVQLMRYFQRSENKSSGLMETGGYGDWMCVICCGPCARSPANQVGAFYFVQGMEFLAELATVLGKGADATEWTSLHSQGLANFHRRFYDEAVGGYSPTKRSGNQPAEEAGSQTSNAMALALGAAPDEKTRTRVLARLVDNVEVENDYHLTVGIMGVQWVLGTLVEVGRGDIALRVMMSDTFPSFGRWIQQNMTTLCESWLCAAHNSAGSANHPSFGSFDVYLHSALGGMRTASNATVTGWKHFIVRPDWAAILKLKAGGLSHETRFGRAAVAWAWQNSTVVFNVTVPIGATAEAQHVVQLGERCTLASQFPDSDKRLDSWRSEYYAVHLNSGTHSLHASYHCR